MAKYKVLIGSDDLGLPLSEIQIGWNSVITWVKDTDSENYRDEIQSEMIMNCARLPEEWAADKVAAFQLLDSASEECAEFQITVQVECDGRTNDVWNGTFNSKNWVIDLDKKTVKFKPVKTYEADCVRSAWTNVVNFYDLDEVVVKPYFMGYEMTEEQVLDCDDPPGLDFYCLESEQGLTPGIIECEDVPLGDFFRFYHRFIADGTCLLGVPVPPDDFNPWEIVEDNCPLDGSIWWVCPPDNANAIVHRYRNGRLFNEAMEDMVGKLNCELLLVSDFFNINPDFTAPSNPAYLAAQLDLHHLVIFQKSDIKRHSATDPSVRPAWDTNFRDFLNDLKLMFNVRWRTENGVLRIEHVSYFESLAGADYTDAKYERILDENTIDIKEITKFKWRDVRATDYFKGHPIEIYCGEGEETKQVALFYTDVSFALTTDGLEAVGDDGFFLMSTYIDEEEEYRIKENNRPLSWTELHFNYHRHDMPGAGKINLNEVDPLSFRKTRKAPRFSVEHCCDDEFDPVNFITTSMGEGDVVTADWNIARDYLSPELIY